MVTTMADGSERQKAQEYLDRVKAGQKAFIQECVSNFGDEVTIESIEFLKTQCFRSYDLRMTLAGDKQEDSIKPEPSLRG